MKEAEKLTKQKYFSTENAAVYTSTHLEDWFETHVQIPIEADMKDFQQAGSGWILNYILRLVVNINKLNQLKGSSYIKLPDQIESKHACVNVKNELYHECFDYSSHARTAFLHDQSTSAIVTLTFFILKRINLIVVHQVFYCL